MSSTASNGSINLAVIGLGGWGNLVARSFHRAANCHLHYVCDSTPATLDRYVHEFPNSIATADYNDVLQDASVDAVALATPAPLHFEMAKSALLADKHVYVEKPMTLCTEHAEELVELAEVRGRKLMVGHLLEYHPAVNLMKQYIDDGSLGEIYYMYCQRVNLGVVRQHENVFWSLAPHDISIILYLFGCEPTEVVATGQAFLQRKIEDVVFVALRFADGRMAHIQVSWLDPQKKRSMVVVGSKRMLVFDDMAPAEKIRIFDKCAFVKNGPVDAMQSISVRHGDILIPAADNSEPLNVETQHFVDCLLNGTQPRSDGNDGLRVVRILEEVNRQLHASFPSVLKYAA